MNEARYLEPSPQLREFQLMELLADRPELSQSSLAELVGLTPARVNAYIRVFLDRRYITTEPRSRGLSYHLTPLGRHCLALHRVSYRAELVRLARAARVRFREFFQELHDRGVRRVVLYGAGETGEVALDALQGTNTVTVLAFVDDDPAKQGREFHGLPVAPLGRVKALMPDAVVVTSVSYGDRIHAKLAGSEIAQLPVYSLAS